MGAIVGLVASGKTVDEVLADYPYLEREDILERYRMRLGGPKKGKCRWPCNENLDRHKFAAPVGAGVCLSRLGGGALDPDRATTASDQDIMAWATENGYAAFTHELEFAALLATTLKSRTESNPGSHSKPIRPKAIVDSLLKSMNQFRNELEKGAIITIDPSRARIRILPLKP